MILLAARLGQRMVRAARAPHAPGGTSM